MEVAPSRYIDLSLNKGRATVLAGIFVAEALEPHLGGFRPRLAVLLQNCFFPKSPTHFKIHVSTTIMLLLAETRCKFKIHVSTTIMLLLAETRCNFKRQIST
jgi:hypothetical protein